MSLTCYQKMSAARIIIRDRFPYFRAALFGATYKEIPRGELKTMAMTERGTLLWDPEDVEKLTVEETAASIMHELLHWLRDHAKRCRSLNAHPRIWNFAADAEINDDIVAMKLKLPKDCIFAKHFQGPDGKPMADGNIAEVYYQSIRQSAQQLKQPGSKGQGKGDGQGEGEGDGEGDESGDSPSAGQGWCGGVAGRHHPKEPKDGGGKGDGQGDKGKGDGQGQDDADGRTEAEAGRIRKAVAEAAVKHAQTKGRGTVPAGFLAWAEAEIAPPKIDWRTKLAKVVKAAFAYRPGAITTSWVKFSRKQAGIGYGVGKPMTPTWRSPVPRVTVVIDTSGSMGAGENSPLAVAASEVSGILKATNSAVTIVACDASVHAIRECRTWQEAVKEFKGGGGTDMRPAFKAIMERRNQLPPEVVICITDGYIGDPGPALPGVKMIWVIVGGMTQPCAPWGDAIIVDQDGAKAA
jgi:predicted metal-dependent peptidase